jgi:hypothetical protein
MQECPAGIRLSAIPSVSCSSRGAMQQKPSYRARGAPHALATDDLIGINSMRQKEDYKWPMLKERSRQKRLVYTAGKPER